MEPIQPDRPFAKIQPPSQAVLAGKRRFDLLCAAAGLVLLSPLLLAIAAAVAFTSPGGALFFQERIGRDGVPFRIMKFRTMRPGAGPSLTADSDPRITPVGRVLRRYKLDELPQLWNVLRGDMSLVGPRPEVGAYVALYTPEQRQIFLVRPGLTDPASIAFCGESALLSARADPQRAYVEELLPQKLALGLSYIQTMSFWGDLRLIFRTLSAVARG